MALTLKPWIGFKTVKDIAKDNGLSVSGARYRLTQLLYAGLVKESVRWEEPHSNYSPIAHKDAPAHQVNYYKMLDEANTEKYLVKAYYGNGMPYTKRSEKFISLEAAKTAAKLTASVMSVVGTVQIFDLNGSVVEVYQSSKR